MSVFNSKTTRITIVFLVHIQCVLALVFTFTQKVSLPLLTTRAETKYATSAYGSSSIGRAFQDIRAMIDKVEFYETVDEAGDDATNGEEVNEHICCCTVPILGNAKITLKPQMITTTKNSMQDPSLQEEKEYHMLLVVEAQSENDVRFLCTKLADQLSTVKNLSTFPLRQIVADFYNALPPHPGYDADLYSTKYDTINKIFSNQHHYSHQRENLFKDLKENGFVVLNSGLNTNPKAVQMLSNILTAKTGQSSNVRSDAVRFLTKEDAVNCGLKDQFELLMGITSYLNDQFEFEHSIFKPLAPGTPNKPLTNPNEIQAASYGFNEFYREHSDNSINQQTGKRSNYRCYTFILYLNDGWDKACDGGALRIYHKSTHITNPLDAQSQCEYYDVNPTNGCLLIFDSRLIHSVQPVTTSIKKRLALTLWTLRPEESGVQGEIYDAGEEVVLH